MPSSQVISAGRDVVVIGASMGGLKALEQLLGSLPADLPAAVFLVLHTSDQGPSILARILNSVSALPVSTAAEEQRFTPGQVYAPPPDHHLLLGHDHLHVRRGPRENGARPAIDPLFRSAAAYCTTRVIGVVLTGLLDDGTAGLCAIKRCGGVAIVQDPRDAAYPDMPRRAIRYVAVDHVLALRDMAGALTALSRETRPQAPEVPQEIQLEALIAAQEVQGTYVSETARLSPLTCPECHGAMQEIPDGELVRFRCHTGHAFTLDTLGAIHGEAWERALYGPLRAQQERAHVVGLMATRARERGAGREAAQLGQRAASYEAGAELLRRLLATATAADPLRQNGDS